MSLQESGFKSHLFEYRHEGSEWGIEIVARSPEDAHNRLKSLAWAQYRGEIKAKFVVPSTGLIRRFVSWFSNAPGGTGV